MLCMKPEYAFFAILFKFNFDMPVGIYHYASLHQHIPLLNRLFLKSLPLQMA